MKVLIDGADLDDSGRRWFLDFSALLPAVATRDVAKLRLPSRSGVTVRKLSWGEGSIKLSVNVPPQRAFGDLPTLPVEERTQQLQALLARASLVTVVVDGKSLSTSVTDVNISDPSRMGPSAWRVEASLTLQPFWVEGSPVTSAARTPPGVLTFTEWAGCTGDVQDGALRLKGPFTRCTVAAADGSAVTVDRSVSASQYVFVDVVGMRAWLGGASDWVPTTTGVLLDYPAAGPLVLSPSVAGVVLTVSGAGFTSVSEVRLRASRFWL